MIQFVYRSGPISILIHHRSVLALDNKAQNQAGVL
jgi:hypothetical protein